MNKLCFCLVFHFQPDPDGNSSSCALLGSSLAILLMASVRQVFMNLYIFFFDNYGVRSAFAHLSKSFFLIINAVFGSVFAHLIKSVFCYAHFCFMWCLVTKNCYKGMNWIAHCFVWCLFEIFLVNKNF